MLDWLPELDLNFSERELNIFRVFIDPSLQRTHNSANEVAQMFRVDCTDSLQLQMRNCLVSNVACLLALPEAKRHHVWLHANEPQTLHGTFGFGSTWKTAIGRVHYDCGCVFDLDGNLKYGNTIQNSHWSAQAAVASFFQSYGAFCLHFLLDDEAHEHLHDQVLTPTAIVSQQERPGFRRGAETFPMFLVSQCFPEPPCFPLSFPFPICFTSQSFP
ncbi:unnamed protein product [Effrenium voratum]|nr:unnamed protein product [Effrenium voratum]